MSVSSRARCDRVEHNSDLKPGSVARSRIQLGEEALDLSYRCSSHCKRAERAVDKNINNFEPKMQDLLRKALETAGRIAARRAVVERCRMRALPQQNVRYLGLKRNDFLRGHCSLMTHSGHCQEALACCSELVEMPEDRAMRVNGTGIRIGVVVLALGL